MMYVTEARLILLLFAVGCCGGERETDVGYYVAYIYSRLIYTLV